jgi:hypothetical protein
MTADEFIALLKNPKAVQNLSYETLEQLILQYPYCMPLRLLMLRKYSENNHKATERYTQLTALYATQLQQVQRFLQEE